MTNIVDKALLSKPRNKRNTLMLEWSRAADVSLLEPSVGIGCVFLQDRSLCGSHDKPVSVLSAGVLSAV